MSGYYVVHDHGSYAAIVWPAWTFGFCIVLMFSCVHQLVTSWPKQLEMNRRICLSIVQWYLLRNHGLMFARAGNWHLPAFNVLTDKAVVANPHIFLSRTTVLFILVIIIMTVIGCRGSWLTLKSHECGRQYNKVNWDNIFFTLWPWLLLKTTSVQITYSRFLLPNFERHLLFTNCRHFSKDTMSGNSSSYWPQSLDPDITHWLQSTWKKFFRTQ